MSNPRIEEISDDEDDEQQILADDPDEMDLDQFDFAKPTGTLASAARTAPPPTQQQQQQHPPQTSLPPDLQALLAGAGGPNPAAREQLHREQAARSKHYQCLYPIYFDARRSRAEGRRVRSEDAVPNPLAREIVEALQAIAGERDAALQVVLDPTKTHPRDWANPGQVRVLVKEGGRAVHRGVENKHHLYKLVAAYLKAHPTTENSPLRLRVPGMPPAQEKVAPPAIPRGVKMGTILPLHSPALSGGGVSENFLKDMMAGMGGQLPPGMEGMANMANMAGLGGAGGPGGGQQPKKVKEKKKK